MDEQDNYWSAGVSAGCINVFNKQGKAIAKHTTPCNSPTMLAFDGDDMRLCLITSLNKAKQSQ